LGKVLKEGLKKLRKGGKRRKGHLINYNYFLKKKLEGPLFQGN